MKGVIVAGGIGKRLYPLTKTTNKNLLPIYDKQMIFYPLETLKKSGVKDIIIISGPGHAGQFLELLASGYDMGLNLSYTIQENPLGIGHAIWVGAREFARRENMVAILGDNIFEDNITKDIKDFKGGAKIFLKRVPNPGDFGVVEMQDNKIKRIIEKPTYPIPSPFAVTGLYIYDKNVYDNIETLELSKRGEIEVTDLNNIYIKKNQMDYRILDGYWLDAGTFEGMFEASKFMRDKK